MHSKKLRAACHNKGRIHAGYSEPFCPSKNIRFWKDATLNMDADPSETRGRASGGVLVAAEPDAARAGTAGRAKWVLPEARTGLTRDPRSGRFYLQPELKRPLLKQCGEIDRKE
jgi:hypothetical protein